MKGAIYRSALEGDMPTRSVLIQRDDRLIERE